MVLRFLQHFYLLKFLKATWNSIRNLFYFCNVTFTNEKIVLDLISSIGSSNCEQWQNYMNVSLKWDFPLLKNQHLLRSLGIWTLEIHEVHTQKDLDLTCGNTFFKSNVICHKYLFAVIPVLTLADIKMLYKQVICLFSALGDVSKRVRSYERTCTTRPGTWMKKVNRVSFHFMLTLTPIKCNTVKGSVQEKQRQSQSINSLINSLWCNKWVQPRDRRCLWYRTQTAMMNTFIEV